MSHRQGIGCQKRLPQIRTPGWSEKNFSSEIFSFFSVLSGHLSQLGRRSITGSLTPLLLLGPILRLLVEADFQYLSGLNRPGRPAKASFRFGDAI
jgi:hypothetical protein